MTINNGVFRELAAGDKPSENVGEYRVSEDVEHGCCWTHSIRQLHVNTRGDGSGYEIWGIVAEFESEEDARGCLPYFNSKGSVQS